MMMMLMEGDQELEATQMMIMKGKRTKRPRLALTTTTTTASSSSTALDDDHQDLVVGPRISVTTTDGGSSSSPTTTSAEFTDISTHQEDQDQDLAANCLILLAQGQQIQQQQQPHPMVHINAAAFECKTCNRCFSSFQALGGHRASHKKLEANNYINNHKVQETSSIKTLSFRADQHRTASTTLSLQISNRTSAAANCNSKPIKKVHECSVCGSEFTSGQALGGHMRRHRNFTNTSTTPSRMISTTPIPQPHLGSKRPRHFLQLDLNLPAPAEDQDHHNRLEITKLPFANSNSSKKEPQVLVFSASQSLVGCHY